MFWLFRLDSLPRYYQFHLSGQGGWGGEEQEAFQQVQAGCINEPLEMKLLRATMACIFQSRVQPKEVLVPQSYKALRIISWRWYLHTTSEVPDSFLGAPVVRMQSLEEISRTIRGSPLWTVFLVGPLRWTRFVASYPAHTLIYSLTQQILFERQLSARQRSSGYNKTVNVMLLTFKWREVAIRMK